MSVKTAHPTQGMEQKWNKQWINSTTIIMQVSYTSATDRGTGHDLMVQELYTVLQWTHADSTGVSEPRLRQGDGEGFGTFF